jgi:hypothetical protein
MTPYKTIVKTKSSGHSVGYERLSAAVYGFQEALKPEPLSTL